MEGDNKNRRFLCPDSSVVERLAVSDNFLKKKSVEGKADTSRPSVRARLGAFNKSLKG